jgi:hypothetical protein
MRTSEVRAQELADASEGSVSVVEHRGEALEHVGDAACDFEADGDIGRGGAGGHVVDGSPGETFGGERGVDCGLLADALTR